MLRRAEADLIYITPARARHCAGGTVVTVRRAELGQADAHAARPRRARMVSPSRPGRGRIAGGRSEVIGSAWTRAESHYRRMRPSMTTGPGAGPVAASALRSQPTRRQPPPSTAIYRRSAETKKALGNGMYQRGDLEHGHDDEPAHG